jgi:RHS repeat-associated protein
LAYNYVYSAAGNMLSSSADFDGNTTSYTYSSVGSSSNFLSTLTDPIGRVLSFQYDTQGRASSQVVFGGGTLGFSYSTDSNGPVTTVKDIDNQVSTYHFNSQYLLTETDLPDGSKQTQTWTSQNQIASFTDELGFTTQYTYNSHGDMTSIQKPLDPSPVEITYDPNFDQVTSIAPLVGAPTSTQVNSINGDILGIQRTSGATSLSETLGYDSFGNPISFKNGIGSFSNQTDPNGLLTFVYDLRNPETRTYDIRGRVITRAFKSGRTLTYTWDNHDRVTRVDDTTGPSTLLSYDVVNRTLTRTMTDGTTNQVTQYQWDTRDRLVVKTDALGNTSTFQFDVKSSNGTVAVIDQPRARIDADGNTTSFSFDNRDRVIQKIDAKGGVTQYQYNLRGDRTAVIDPLNQKTTFSFDGNRRLISEVRPSLTTSTNGKTAASTENLNYFYDLSGKLVRIEKPSLLGGKSVISFSFDMFDRLIEKIEQRLDKNGKVTLVEDDSTFSYSPELDRVLMTQANNGVENLSFGYDPAPPFAPVSYSAQAKDPKNSLSLIQGQYTVSYDGTNQIQSIVDATGKTAFTSSHDEAGRLLQMISGNIVGDEVKPFSAALKYDSFGRKSQVSFSDSSSGSMQYDLDNRVSQIQWQTSNIWFMSDSLSEQLSYDPAGNVLAQVREFGKQSYSYDPTNQLTSVVGKGSAQGFFGKTEDDGVAQALDQSYGYDLAGNRTLASTNGKSEFIDNQIVSDEKAVFQSDADGFGNLSAETPVSDPHLSRNYTYRTDGKLTQMNVIFDEQWRCDPSIKEIVTQTQYSFDALGRRVGKQTKYAPNLGGRLGPNLGMTQAYSYLVNKDKILLAKSGDGTISLYLDGQGIDEHLAEVSRNTSQGFFTDHVGSVLNNSLAGTLHAYDAFGRSVASLPLFPSFLSSDPALYGFAGRQFDVESGKYYNRARMYDPNTGRFMQQDPLGIAGGLNLYRYAENAPVGKKDPSGLCDLFDPEYDLPDSAYYDYYGSIEGAEAAVSVFYTGAAAASVAGLSLAALGPEALAVYLSNPALAEEYGIAGASAIGQFLTGDNLPYEPGSDLASSFVGNVSSNIINSVSDDSSDGD